VALVPKLLCLRLKSAGSLASKFHAFMSKKEAKRVTPSIPSSCLGTSITSAPSSAHRRGKERGCAVLCPLKNEPPFSREGERGGGKKRKRWFGALASYDFRHKALALALRERRGRKIATACFYWGVNAFLQCAGEGGKN